MKALIIVAGLLAMVSCREAVRQVQKERVVQSALRLQNYSGIFSERYGPDEAPVQYAVEYHSAENYFYSEVKSSGARRGSVYYFYGDVVRLYYPRTKFGVEFTNLPVPNQEQKIAALERSFDWHLDTYQISLLGTQDLLNQTTVGIHYEARAKDRFLFDWRAWVIEELALPLKIQMEKNGQLFYQSAFSRVDVNSTNSWAKVRHFKFPPGATVARYDYNSKAYDINRVRQGANFTFKTLNEQDGFIYEKGVRVKGIIPGFTLFYNSPAGRLSITMVKDYGIRVVPAPAGLELGLGADSKTKGRLSFFGNQTVINFKKQGVFYTLIGDAPYPMLLRAASGLCSPHAK